MALEKNGSYGRCYNRRYSRRKAYITLTQPGDYI